MNGTLHAFFLSVVAFLLLGPVSPIRAAAPVAAFEAANKLYEEGKFNEASSAYEDLLKSGARSAAVCFNLGNAFFKSGQLGRAVTAYRAAEALNPRDPDIRANLRFARNQAKGPSAPRSAIAQWLNQLTINEWTLVCSASLSLLLLAFISIQFRPNFKALLRWPIILLSAATLLTGLSIVAAWHFEHSQQNAVVITAQAEVRHGPLDESQAAFVAHDGSELVVLDAKDQWLQVSAGPRRIGWIKKDQVLLFPSSHTGAP